MLSLSELRETKVYQEALQEGEKRGETRGVLKGRQEEARALILRQLTRRIREIDPECEAQARRKSFANSSSISH